MDKTEGCRQKCRPIASIGLANTLYAAKMAEESLQMAQNYLRLYEKVLNGEALNPKPPKLIQGNVPKFLPWHED